LNDSRDSDRRETGSGSGASNDAIDTGEPIELLQAVAVVPRAGFMARIRSSIQRRTLGSQFADLSWKAVTTVIMEYLTLAFGLFSASGRNQRGSE
jgi:hypothetical protein